MLKQAIEQLTARTGRTSVASKRELVEAVTVVVTAATDRNLTDRNFDFHRPKLSLQSGTANSREKRSPSGAMAPLGLLYHLPVFADQL